MTAEQWRRVGELFHEALEKPAEQRRQWVEEACAGDVELRAEVLSLLGSDALAGEGFIERNLQPAVASLLQTNASVGIPSRVGPYRLIRELGRGGMGTVYLAERDDEEYQAQVAIKLVRRGMDTEIVLNRFYRERQTLARLQHTNIARLLDGGTTPEGSPYIVMEYVEGSRVTTYCKDRDLSIARRLGLFLNVCKAVSYAHRQFVVHRDIKPGNILVDDAGDVKLLDFGICKLLHAEPQKTDETVEMALLALTPDYASPEQIRGDPITVASDVYSLGAVLYELLTGVKPHKIEDHTLRGMERAICETEIVRPSLACGNKAQARQLQGDLDNILTTALDKDPQRRYESVEQFAEDIRRHLQFEPVSARPSGWAYRAGKFLRRRSGLVLAATSVLVTLSAGVFMSVRSAREARDNLRLVRQLSNTFLFDVHDAVRELPGSTRARQLIVETALQYLENLARSGNQDADFDHELGSAYRRIGEVQGGVMGPNLGNTKGALKSYERSLSLLESAARKDPNHRGAIGEQILVYRLIGNLQTYAKGPNHAYESFAKGEEVAKAQLVRFPGDPVTEFQLGELYLARANADRLAARWKEAADGYTKAIRVLEKFEGVFSDYRTMVSVAAAYSGRGMCEVRLGHFDQALRAYRKAGDIREKLLQAEPSNAFLQRELMVLYSHMGDVLGNPNLSNMGDRNGAAREYEKVVAIARRLRAADPANLRARSDYATALGRMAAVLEARESIPLHRESIQLMQEVAKADTNNVSTRTELAAKHKILGDALVAIGDFQSARESYRAGLQIAEPILGEGTPMLPAAAVMMYRALGEIAGRSGERTIALQYAEKAWRLADPSSPAQKGRALNAQSHLVARAAAAKGYIHAALARSREGSAGDRVEARKWLDEGLRLYGALAGEASPKVREEIEALRKERERWQ